MDGHRRPLWKGGSLPIGWVIFYNHTVGLDRSWHVLGLGYDSGVKQQDIEKAAVIHFDGVRKPWLDIGLPKYKGYHWQKPHLTFFQHLRHDFGSLSRVLPMRCDVRKRTSKESVVLKKMVDKLSDTGLKAKFLSSYDLSQKEPVDG
ncbi:unnamed protein product [Thlaspi arvense]|uniref:Hexosyltransferase n=1 Tax=Thlaspi arvense TaxID=13288 RepID=A0AAU9S0N8_THLAR|nr:unnamed protein product [Thlaspi arvense]